MSRKIITISREFGSGGHTVGKMVAEILGVPYYDRELIQKIAQETGLAEGYVEQNCEDAPSKSRLINLFSYSRNTGELSLDQYLWAAQNKIIRDLAEQGPCVFIGRCSDYILKDREDCLHAFLYADPSDRAQRIVQLYGQREKSPEKRLAEKDKKRILYYEHYTDQKWGAAQNYHICMNTHVVGLQRCAEILVSLVREEE